jgi:predicted nucleotidyltransferase
MDRDKATEKLVRMVQVIADGALPAPVKAFYVFGSYARGAPNPNDLDVVVVYENPGRDYWQSLDVELRESGKDPILNGGRVFQTRMRGGLRRPGERVDIMVTESIDNITGSGSKIRKDDLVLLWTPEDHDFQSKLAAIKTNAAVGRAERDHFVNLRRLYDSISVMEEAVRWIKEDVLVLTRVPIDTIDLQLNTHHTLKLEYWQKCGVMGRKSIELLPYAMWWLQQYRQRSQPPHQTEVWSESWTHRVDLGKPSLEQMMWIFGERPRVRRQCLIPHLRAHEPNELLVFERGPQWKNRTSERPSA